MSWVCQCTAQVTVLSDGSTVRSRYVPTKRADVAAGLVSVHVSPTLQHTAAHCNTLHETCWCCFWPCECSCLLHTATHCNNRNTPLHTATHCNTLHEMRWCCLLTCELSLLLYTTYCNTLQHTATHTKVCECLCIHCNILQHTATHTKVFGCLCVLQATIHCNTHCNTRYNTRCNTQCNTPCIYIPTCITYKSNRFSDLRVWFGWRKCGHASKDCFVVSLRHVLHLTITSL